MWREANRRLVPQMRMQSFPTADDGLASRSEITSLKLTLIDGRVNNSADGDAEPPYLLSLYSRAALRLVNTMPSITMCIEPPG